MYKRESGNWLKHGDFIILDILCIQIALLVAYMFRNGFEFPWKNDTYQQMAFILTIMDIVVVFFMQSYKGILRRGYFQEFKETLLHVSATITGFILFNFITKSGQQYSRMVVVLMWEIAIILCYMIRVWRKKVLKSRAALTQKGKKALVILSDYAMAETFAGRISKNNYSDRKLAGIIVTDRDLTGQTIKGIPVVADRKNAVNYLCQNWVDEVITCYNNNEDVINPILEDCQGNGNYRPHCTDKMRNRRCKEENRKRGRIYSGNELYYLGKQQADLPQTADGYLRWYRRMYYYSDTIPVCCTCNLHQISRTDLFFSDSCRKKRKEIPDL